MSFPSGSVYRRSIFVAELVKIARLPTIADAEGEREKNSRRFVYRETTE